MSNPYESPSPSPLDTSTAPLWYTVFSRLYWPLWWVGVGLIAASWIGVVQPEVGWIGFAMAGAASLGSYVLPSLAGISPSDYVALDSRLLTAQGETYRDLMKRFAAGATLTYDGVSFRLASNSEIACATVSPSAEADEAAAREAADHARSVFDVLNSRSPEFAAAVQGRSFRISILSNYESQGREVCRVVDGEFVWRK